MLLFRSLKGCFMSYNLSAKTLSHNPPAPELLDLLDKMGFLVMDEACDEWKQSKLQTLLYGLPGEQP
jgi:Glycosyl hydrolases family 2, TIM barrel domain